MKRLILAFAMAFTLSSCGVGYYAYDTPVPVTGSINISLQPSWGPAGYDYAMYYYFPEFNFYYDVERAVFHYLNYGRWVSAKVLPHGRHFPSDLHRYYKVVINHRNPWHYNRQHKNQYKHYKGVYNQRNLRDVRGNGYYQNNPRTESPRRIHYQNSTPSRNNNTTMQPQGNPNRGQGSRGNVGQGTTNRGQGNIARPSGNSRNNSSGNVRPGNNSSRNNSSGNVRPGNQGSSQKGNTGSKSSTNSRNSSSQSSSGSRSTGSRGR